MKQREDCDVLLDCRLPLAEHRHGLIPCREERGGAELFLLVGQITGLHIVLKCLSKMGAMENYISS